MLAEEAKRQRRALGRPAVVSLMQQCSGRIDSIERLASAMALPIRVVSSRLGILRRHGAAKRVTVYDPTRLGRPFQAITYVALRQNPPEVRKAFERRCVEDPEVTTAVQITGQYDYALTTFHRDKEVARRWLLILKTVDGVGRVDQKPVEGRFGHALPGAPLLWSQTLDHKTRRHTLA